MKIIIYKQPVILTLKEIELLEKWINNHLKENVKKTAFVDCVGIIWNQKTNMIELNIFYFPKKNISYTDAKLLILTPEEFGEIIGDTND